MAGWRRHVAAWRRRAGRWATTAVFLLPQLAAARLPSLEARRLDFDPPAVPWPKRGKAYPALGHPRGLGLIDLSQWPPEPATPVSVSEEKLAPAISLLCGDHLEGMDAVKYARWVVKASREFQVDPLLLAGLIYYRSGCRVPKQVRHQPMGFVGVDWETHSQFFRERSFRFWVLDRGHWVPRELDTSAYLASRDGSFSVERQIYYAAALMHAYQHQCPDIDSRFSSVPHRSYISHLVFGDRVSDSGPEDWILLARRRLLEHYQEGASPPLARFKSLPLRSPLDGPPRVITGALGDARGGGRSAHRGLDFASVEGEPVRAIADGWVIFAGVQGPSGRGSRNLPPHRTHELNAPSLGAGGVFVMIQHKEELVSAYMHLQSSAVRKGQWVKAGTLVGLVGRTGIKISPAHLHFELILKGQHIDPVPHLAGLVFPLRETYWGRFKEAIRPLAFRKGKHQPGLPKGRKQAGSQEESDSSNAPDPALEAPDD